ncbi:MAG: alpha-L-arabinofuranosidase C-terminal domain-containing protein [Bryobacteraceae bacterium]|nr:alpha-L-arabinofuranosidase C-terminal domain-containing protein [Bryobacteraceae bacterium]
MKWPCLVVLLVSALLAQDAVIRVDASKRAAQPIPRTIYGTFLEPIGNAIYNGLWAQMLENPSFEGGLWDAAATARRVEQEPSFQRPAHIGLPLPWEPLISRQGARYEPRWNQAANSYRWLVLMALPGAVQTGIRQQVYLPHHRTRDYRGRLYAKHLSGAPSVEVSLRRRNHSAEVFAAARIAIKGEAWAAYDFSLQLPAGKLSALEPADFVIAAQDETRVGLDQVTLFPADAVEGMDPEMIALSRDLKTPIVRFGGNFTSAYHWRDGVGPMDQRVNMVNLSWGMPEYNYFGTDELLKFCKLIGAEPQIALNLGTGTPEEAADWVRYVNERWNGGQGGLWWELGNELWGDFQHGYPTLERIGGLTRRFSEAVKRADPRAKLIATGQDPDHFEAWNAEQLKNPVGTFDLLATHFVVGMATVWRAGASADEIALAGFALPVELERRLREMKKQIEASPHAGKVNIAFTEWLFHAFDDRSPRFHNMGGAIAAAGLLNTFLRTADFVPVNDMTGLIEFGGIWKHRGRVYGVPAYWAFRMYSTADATRLVDSRTEVETYDITEGNNRLPNIAKVPFLDVVAAVNERGDKLTLFCVNRHLHRDFAARIELGGFAGSKAKVSTLTAGSIYTANNETRPEGVIPATASVAVPSGNWTHAFPRSSVTVIEVSR